MSDRSSADLPSTCSGGIQKPSKMALFLVYMAPVLSGMTAVGDVVSDVLMQGLAFLDGEAVLRRVHNAALPQGRVGNVFGQGPIRRSTIRRSGGAGPSFTGVVIPGRGP